MYVVAFHGSPRSEGNTASIVKQALKGAEEAGASVECIQIPKLNISGCQGCAYCKGHQTCRIDDDMQELYEKIIKADAVILASPVYFSEMTGQIKQFIDRWVALIDENFQPIIPAGKKAAVIVTQGSPDTEQFKKVLSTFDFALNYLKFEVKDHLIIGGLFNPDDVLSRTADLDQAYQIGRNLVI
jgi:multimeric flavodoxin WrbA